MNKPTPGPWKVLSEYYPESQKQEVFPFILDSKGRNVAAALCGSFADEEVNANAALIVAAVNACFAINPSNPLAVAERIPDVIAALREAKRYFYQRPGNWEQQLFDTICAALAKLEAKS